ncbi:hypothetical protein BT96DRAFT_43807 [Gymnopus androsaceus JB14]|uniref:Uncharacterized protein n=1 Tax=Gymnopus androsaceus JB14 TaxID=1447944 RepID=A0A6A4HKN5_9AGAR|nr:hypothetical protein BT96DRAFT_43807 [Gymnopus androsaceus JB14]
MPWDQHLLLEPLSRCYRMGMVHQRTWLLPTPGPTSALTIQFHDALCGLAKRQRWVRRRSWRAFAGRWKNWRRSRKDGEEIRALPKVLESKIRMALLAMGQQDAPGSSAADPAPKITSPPTPNPSPIPPELPPLNISLKSISEPDLKEFTALSTVDLIAGSNHAVDRNRPSCPFRAARIDSKTHRLIIFPSPGQKAGELLRSAEQ